jgi:hypothetical protein
MKESTPLWVVDFIFSVDSFVYTMYINGSKIAMASVISILCYMMTMLFKSINEEITLHLKNKKRGNDIILEKKLLTGIIEKYQLICDMLKQFEKCFGFTLTLFFFSLFIITWIEIFFIASTANSNDPWNKSVDQAMGFYFYWLPTLLIYYYASNFNIESQKLSSLVNTMCLSSASSFNSQYAQFGSLFPPLKITLSNTFTLNRKFLPSLVCSVVTFSVMLIQLNPDAIAKVG